MEEDLNNKYTIKNPYYSNGKIMNLTDNQEVVNNRLDEIDKKDIKYIESQANKWGKTLIEKDLLTRLHDFDFWKEWKNK